MTSIVIPAHNEARVIGRLLDALLSDAPASGAGPGPDIVVVCNGCTDDTAAVAGARGPRVRVVQTPAPGKHGALRLGDEHAEGFPRLYVDADVVLRAADVRALEAALADGQGVLAAAPGRDLPLAGCTWAVRAYYRVWQLLPAVREGLFGRGVIAVTERGHARIAALPPVMADDLAASLAFAPAERRVVEEARVVVSPPRTWGDLLRRRIRAATSSAELERVQAAARGAGEGGGGAAPSARTGTADLRALVRARPGLLPSVGVFLVAAAAARRGARRAIRAGDFSTWLRDESSRTG
ncbi:MULTISPECIES: glycosyltransferase family 2 protein [Streptomyces]|uniref:glycosyltransferase family 2 protein n=1 Tax=Streptomyces TaxID=1883 RepID=UPI000F745C44|nr:glycosyltransferase [Streptomyces sp. WAC05292]RSS89718.1 glycosyltransferase [Streptomyces sp. WAC05292]